MITILSPAKNLDFKSTTESNHFSLPEFLDKSAVLLKELQKLNPTDIAKLMQVNNNIAVLNFERFLSWRTPFTSDNAKQALLAFKGQVYIGLDAKSLSNSDLEFVQDHLRILSGLYGILRPLDLIQAYRLEMGTKLKNPEGKNLYAFWGNHISKTLNTAIAKQKHKVLINLASNEYFKAIVPSQINAEIITPVFKEAKGNTYKMIVVYAKNARGLMSRFIIQNRITNPSDIKAFDTDNYLFNSELSTKTEWVFTR